MINKLVSRKNSGDYYFLLTMVEKAIYNFEGIKIEYEKAVEGDKDYQR